jgi:hypothetical protein
MAMEDAIALVAALDEVRTVATDPDGIDAALAVYEAERHGQVARIQDAPVLRCRGGSTSAGPT